MFTPRWAEPETNNKYYIGTAYGGLNKCIVRDNATGDVLPNCTGLAYGLFMELTGVEHCNLPTGDAGNWYRSVGNNYEKGSVPKLGSVACWSGGTNGKGHVAVVEKIDGNTITVAESGYYSGIRFQLSVREYPYNFNGLTFQGFIYNPNVTAEKFVIPEGRFETSYLGNKIVGYGQRSSQKVGLISAKGENPHTALQKITEIDNEDIIIYASMNANYFQMRTDQSDPYGEHYGTEISFTNEFVPHKGNVLAYALRIGSESVCMPDSQFWWGRDEVQFACAPAYVPYMNGQRVDLWSEEFKGSKANITQQSMLIRTKDRYALAVCKDKVSVQLLTEWAENNVDGLLDLCFMDSGGSSQIIIGYDTPLLTDRPISTALCIFSDKTVSEPIQNDDNGEGENTMPVNEVPNNEENKAKSILPNNVYDVLKWVALIMLPALSSWVLFMGSDLSANYELIAKWISGIAVLIGSLIGVSTVQYNATKSGGE